MKPPGKTNWSLVRSMTSKRPSSSTTTQAQPKGGRFPASIRLRMLNEILTAFPNSRYSNCLITSNHPPFYLFLFLCIVSSIILPLEHQSSAFHQHATTLAPKPEQQET